MKQKYLISLFALIIFILFGYWAKCQTGTNFFESTSLSKLTPFKYLQRNDVVSIPKPGIILYDCFDTKSIIGNWSNLWMRDKGKVSVDYDLHGINNSRCLLIKSTSTKSWAYSHNKSVEVHEGDIFSFDGFARIQGEKNVSAFIGIAAFDGQNEPIKWNYISEKIDNTEMWTKKNKTFVIPDNIKYIRFRLTGVGIGEFRFDDIFFRKENLSTN
ncbi:hypothetical protein [Candidatus Scalindua japonica]|nr:hypothetical protein [Candidatus Scalindua japonica]